MNTKLLLTCNNLLWPRRRVTMKLNPRSSPFISSVAGDNHSEIKSSPQPKTVYNDSWLDRIVINFISKKLQTATGLSSKKSGYEGMVEVTTMASQKFTPTQQTDIIIQTLVNAFPNTFLRLHKALLPPSKFAREYYAAFTKKFFVWLLGPCEVRESEFQGKIEKNVVHIKKCRLLEATNCVGICTGLCKMPTQIFIKEHCGMPVYIVPNFEDISCQFIYGEEPPPKSSDPAFSQPCYKQCKAIKRHQRNCVK